MSDIERTDRLPAELPLNPMPLASSWIKEASARAVQRNPDAMTIVSIADDGKPSARVVLCKDFVTDPGYLVFYTNYRSRKGTELLANKNAAALFHWDALGRQIRIEGTTTRSPEAESDAYFETRHWGSQLGAWGSDQSAPVESRDALVTQISNRGIELGLSLENGTQRILNENVPRIDRPPHWGGFRLWITSIELWVEGVDRIHDRGLWSRDILNADREPFRMTPWSSTRLQP
ncbi:MAG: pyridoxine/pyridoxamine 5'-phosphate oxidase [Woeseiaceae bacterium]